MKLPDYVVATKTVIYDMETILADNFEGVDPATITNDQILWALDAYLDQDFGNELPAPVITYKFDE